MRLDRCLLIACVTLSQACDSKRSERAPVAEPPAPEPELVVTATAEGILVDGKLLEPFINGTLPADVVDDKYRPLKLVPLLDKVTGDSIRLAIDKQLSTLIVYQIMAAAPWHVTRFKIGTFELRRGQEPSTATLSTDEILMSASQEVLALHPKATLSARLLDAVTRLPDRKRFDLVVDRRLTFETLVEVTEPLASRVESVGISLASIDDPSMLVSFQTPHALSDYLRKNERAVRRCFELSRTRDGPKKDYDVRVTLKFDDHGLVDVQPMAHLISPTLSKCLSSAILAWDLTLPPGPYEFHIVLEFK